MFERPEYPPLDPKTLTPALNPILVVDGAGLNQVKKFLDENNEYVKDYEFNVTEGFYRRRARTLQLGNRDVQYIIDFLAFADGDTKKLIHGQGGYRREGALLKMYTEDETSFEVAPVNTKTFQPIVDVVGPSFESDSHLKIAHFSEAEYTTSKWCLGLRPWHFYDTYIAERALWNGIPTPKRDFYGLDDLIGRYFHVAISKDEQKTFDLHSPLTDRQIIYAALDIRLPLGVKGLQEPKIAKAQLGWTIQIENDAVPAFGDMHLNGLYVNPTKWQKIIDKNEADLKDAVEELDSHFIPLVGLKGEPPNPELVEQAHAAIEECAVPSVEEEQISLLIKEATAFKDKKLKADVKAVLTARRKELQAARTALKEERKAYHKSISHLGTKTYAKEYDSKAGRADINYNSAPQVMDALRKLPHLGFSEKTLPDLDAKTTLMKFMHLPIIQAYVRVKKLEKQLGTYGYRWITTRDMIVAGTKKTGFVDPDTGRIHPPFRQMGTDTGRPSCADPNVLNLPKDKRFREAFEARDGHMNVTKDCAGQELRILTQFSQEPSWIDAFLNDKDVHSISTAMIRPEMWQNAAVMQETMMRIEEEDALIPACAYYTKNYKKCKCPEHEATRGKFKAVNFGVIYDKSAYSLAIELGIPEEEAEEILESWKETFRITQATLEKIRLDAYERGEARTLSGRRRIITKVSRDQVERKMPEKLAEKLGIKESDAQEIVNAWKADVRAHAAGYYSDQLEQKLKEEKFKELEKPPTAKQLQRLLESIYRSLVAAAMREGGNMPIQGTGADMMKLAMGCGFDEEGNPFLWHILEPMYSALMENYVYDEFMVETPEAYCDIVGGPNGVGGVVSDAIIRAGAQFVTVVPMASEGKVAKTWTK